MGYYHQDERDWAVGIGCFALIAIFVLIIILFVILIFTILQ